MFLVEPAASLYPEDGTVQSSDTSVNLYQTTRYHIHIISCP